MQLSPKQLEYTVYVHTNKVNGKRYFGITRQNVNRRWQNGRGYQNTYFWNAIQKYGWNGFSHEIVRTGLTREEACELEIRLIEENGTNKRENGYNIASGGQTCDCICGKCGEDHPNHQRVKMISVETGETLKVFGSQVEAAEKLGIKRQGITKACLGKGAATYKGYRWEYADKAYDRPQNVGAGNYSHDKIKKPIIVTEENGVIWTFDSIKSAAEQLKVKRSNISRYLTGSRKDASGRRWEYATFC